MTSTVTALELIQNAYAAFGRGDIAYILAHVAPGCRWVSPGEGIPTAGVYIGPEGAADFFTRLAASEEIVRFEPQQYFTNGDGVVAIGVEECRMPATGKSASTNWAMKFTTHDGMITSFEPFYDTAAYVRAHQK